VQQPLVKFCKKPLKHKPEAKWAFQENDSHCQHYWNVLQKYRNAISWPKFQGQDPAILILESITDFKVKIRRQCFLPRNHRCRPTWLHYHSDIYAWFFSFWSVHLRPYVRINNWYCVFSRLCQHRALCVGIFQLNQETPRNSCAPSHSGSRHKIFVLFRKEMQTYLILRPTLQMTFQCWFEAAKACNPLLSPSVGVAQLKYFFS